MKNSKATLFLMALFVPFLSFAQVTEAPEAIESPDDGETGEEVFMVVEEMPEFPGGEDEMSKYLAENITYPEKVRQLGIEGLVVVSFIVDKKGNVKDAKILKSAIKELDKEALRVVNNMPRWKPGLQRGEKVNVQINLPIRFKLSSGKEKNKRGKCSVAYPLPINRAGEDGLITCDL